MTMRRSKTFVELGVVLALCAATAACSSNKTESGPSGLDPNNNNDPNGGSAHGGSGELMVPTNGTGGNDAPGSSGGAETLTPETACATGTASAALTPVDMFIQFDRSGSMNQPKDMPKWPQAASALNAFFKDPTTAGLSVALHFFPDDRPMAGCSGGDAAICSAVACGTPLVPLAPLTAESAPTDTQEGLLVASVNDKATTPKSGNNNDSAGTPLYPALQGALDWANAHQVAVPDHKTVVILVTDGQPHGCESSDNARTDLANMAKLASDALAKTGVRTYTIGIQGSEQATMDTIAAAGGTTKGFFIGAAANTQTELIAALNMIRGSVISCDFPVPKAASAGQPVDPAKINVNFTPSGGAVQLIGKTAGAAACQDGGWYYDNPTAPATINLCPSTCMQVQADAKAKLDVLLGCSSQVVVPK